MKKLICVLTLLLATNSFAAGFLYQLDLLTIEQIKALSEVELKANYMEAKIEERASAEFHEAAGFSSAKEYNLRKNLLRYIIYLRTEMRDRDIEPDPLDEWLR